MSAKPGVIPLQDTAGGTVTSVSVVSANGLAGTVATATTTPAITLSTTVTGVLKGNGTAISAAANSDLPAMTATVGGAVPTPPNDSTKFLNGQGVFAVPASGTGTVTHTAGNLTANQVVIGNGTADLKTLGSLGTTTTLLHGNAAGAPTFGAVDLTADVSGILLGANGGTANGFTAFSGPTTTLKTFALPNASSTILTTNAAVTVAQGGTGLATLTLNNVLLGNGTSTPQFVAPGTSGNVLTSNGTTWASTAAAGGGSMIFLSLVTAAAASTMDFDTTFDSTYDSYLIQIPIITLGSAGAFLEFRLKIGGTYQTGLNYYSHAAIPTSTATAYAANVKTAAATGRISTGFDADAASTMNLSIWVHNVTSTTKAKMIYWLGTEFAVSNPDTRLLVGSGGFVGTNTALTGVRLLPDTGTITGTGRLYGIKNS